MIIRIARNLALLLLVGLVAAGCTRASNYADSSKFSSVYTAGYRLPGGKNPKDLRLPKTFPKGLRGTERKGRKTHFIEFRARNALSYGHASVAFGKLDSRGRIPRKRNGDLKPGVIEISGLHPASDSNAVYSAGHFVPVFASTGPSDGDDEAAYALATWRIKLTRAEFRRTVAIIKRRKETTTHWNGIASSCVTYLRMIARDMGLRTPITRHLPESFVMKLARINGGKGRLARASKSRRTKKRRG